MELKNVRELSQETQNGRYREKGQKEGRKEGEREERRRIARSLLPMMGPEEIAKVTGLSVEEIKKLKMS